MTKRRPTGHDTSWVTCIHIYMYTYMHMHTLHTNCVQKQIDGPGYHETPPANITPIAGHRSSTLRYRMEGHYGGGRIRDTWNLPYPSYTYFKVASGLRHDLRSFQNQAQAPQSCKPTWRQCCEGVEETSRAEQCPPTVSQACLGPP